MHAALLDHGVVTLRDVLVLGIAPATAARLLATYAATTDATVGKTVIEVGGTRQVYAVWRRWCLAPQALVAVLNQQSMAPRLVVSDPMNL